LQLTLFAERRRAISSRVAILSVALIAAALAAKMMPAAAQSPTGYPRRSIADMRRGGNR
jgi:hypothetical protein